ncbi:hypothetical protein [Cupriavidus sp. UYPR2.512]|uniref:hypothetical protein n=1 Tax=Cupriavidus sp. UYPR2.512 TaxID=1080187 RepID=UPI0003A8B430|nr:hypothetical protein [Cupriavidus sp. UYPR2.512]
MEHPADEHQVLMLTHRVLAAEQGYASLPTVFRYNESFTRKEHPYISYFVDVLEPACEAFANRKYGMMFEALGSSVPPMRRPADKTAWARRMDELFVLRTNASVGEVLDHLRRARRPRLPDAIEDRERDLAEFDRDAGEEMPAALSEVDKLRAVPYSEIQTLRSYLEGFSPFETKHGVKGAEFENVLMIIGRGWNQYNFNEMLELASTQEIPANRLAAYERNRNLFYVACSRPRKRLALLLTQQLSQAAMGTLQR